MSVNGTDYTPMENLLTRIHGRYIKLSESDVRRNNILLNRVISQIITKMKGKSTLFANMYSDKYYGGSFYDGLKVGQPDEYDLDCLLYLPKDAGGYVHIQLQNMHKLREKKENLEKFKGLDGLLDSDNYLQTDKVLHWMKSVLTLALNDFDIEQGRRIIRFCNCGKYESVSVTVHNNGPALMLKITDVINGQSRIIDVDLVTCFKFFEDQWPYTSVYTPNPSTIYRTFFVVPKPYNNIPSYWRLSFQEQEKELLRNDYKTLKPTMRLLKKIKDEFHPNIASYYIKTIFLRELKYGDVSLWHGTLSNAFMFMIKKYADYIKRGEIPYYWNEHHNLIGNVTPITRQNIANRLERMISDIDRNLSNNPYVVAKYLIPGMEIIRETELITFCERIPQPVIDNNRLITVEGTQQEAARCHIL